jgi:DNA-binding NarL/FixJ family response regulator
LIQPDGRLDAERIAVIFDRKPLWREAIGDLLGQLGLRVVGKLGDGEALMQLVDSGVTPDILVIGIDDAGANALEWLRELKDRLPSLRALVVSHRDDPASIEAAFAAGATVYCLKTTEPRDFASAVRQAISPSVFFARWTSDPIEDAAVTRLIPNLTSREQDVLRLVVEGHSNAQLARMLWVTEQTVKFHLSNIYRKLKVSNRTEASRWAYRHGFLDERMDSGARRAGVASSG